MPADSRRILLVDDVPMFRELGQIFLSRSGPVDLAESAVAAFRLAAGRPPAIVIADMHLPDMDGAALCAAFKRPASGPAPRVVLLARPDASADHAEAVRAGADDVLFKPLEREALIRCVRRLTESSAPRGLPRAEVEQRIEIYSPRQRSPIEGIVRNVSRGGIAVSTDRPALLGDEVTLSFSLEGMETAASPTARVVWSRLGLDGRGLYGLRFLEIDARTVESLDVYIADHTRRSPAPPTA
jgi:DNA-binding response OmpR family regulator